MGGGSRFPKNRFQKMHSGKRREFKALVTRVSGNKREFESFVKSNCSGVDIIRVDVDAHGNGYVCVANEKQLSVVSSNLTGKLFKEEELKVTIAGDQQKKSLETAVKQREELKNLVKDRYDEQRNILNLSSLSSSVAAIQVNSANALKPLFDAIKEICPGVLALNLADNGITRLEPFRELLRACPAIEHLSVSGNNIKRIEQFRELKGLPIRHIHIENNPVANSGSLEKIVREITMIFPSLESVNGQQFGSFSNFGVTFEKLEVPATTFNNMLDSNQLEILLKFVYDCDQDPNKLIDVCENESQFSMTIDPEAVKQFISTFPRVDVKNRNLKIVSSDATKSRLEMLFLGKANIFKRRSDLPKFTMNKDTLQVESFVMPDGKSAWIFLYGELTMEQETKTKSIASTKFGFSRTVHFKAAAENPQYQFLIANDMVHLFKGVPQSMVTRLTPDNQKLLTEYVRHYKLDVTTALNNLKRARWNPQEAAYYAENPKA